MLEAWVGKGLQGRKRGRDYQQEKGGNKLKKDVTFGG